MLVKPSENHFVCLREFLPSISPGAGEGAAGEWFETTWGLAQATRKELQWLWWIAGGWNVAYSLGYFVHRNGISWDFLMERKRDFNGNNYSNAAIYHGCLLHRMGYDISNQGSKWAFKQPKVFFQWVELGLSNRHMGNWAKHRLFWYCWSSKGL